MKTNQRYQIKKTFEYNQKMVLLLKIEIKIIKLKKILARYGLKTDFFGFQTKLPIGVVAGTLHNLDYLEMAIKDDFEVLIWKTFRSEECLAHRNKGNYLGHNIVFYQLRKLLNLKFGKKELGI